MGTAPSVSTPKGPAARRGPGRPQAPVPQEAFLSAARRVFAEDGHGGATIARIAELAGVTKAAVLHRFGSKDALYGLTLSGIADDLRALVAEEAQAPGALGTRLDRLGARIVRYLAADPYAARLLVRELVDGGPFLERHDRGLVERTVATTRELLAAGIATGELAAQDPDHLAGSIIAIHLFWFAARPVSAGLIGEGVSETGQVEARVRAVTTQVRRLCGLPLGDGTEPADAI
jgi:AcrR family transcriptional regulator